MPLTPFIRLVLLTCVASLLSCGTEPDSEKGVDPGDDTANNTVISLIIADPNSDPDELAFNVDVVTYRIVCQSSEEVPFDDSVDVIGNFGIVDGSDPPIWQVLTDLPASFCTISMWVFNDEEIVCSGTQPIVINEDGDPTTINEFSLVLLCSLSVDSPTGDLDIIGDFTEVVGNTCPRLIWMNAVPSVFGPGDLPIALIEVYSFDPNGTCGNNCDPQTCDFSVIPPVCSPGPDTGHFTSFYTPSGHGTVGDSSASSTTYTCDPAFPGPTEICVNASDGDVECDQVRCTTIQCP